MSVISHDCEFSAIPVDLLQLSVFWADPWQMSPSFSNSPATYIRVCMSDGLETSWSFLNKKTLCDRSPRCENDALLDMIGLVSSHKIWLEIDSRLNCCWQTRKWKPFQKWQIAWRRRRSAWAARWSRARARLRNSFDCKEKMEQSLSRLDLNWNSKAFAWLLPRAAQRVTSGQARRENASVGSFNNGFTSNYIAPHQYLNN